MTVNTQVESLSQTMKFSNFFEMVKDGGKYQCLTPDGWQDIGDVYLKTNKNKSLITLKSGNSIITSDDHLFEVMTSLYDESDEIFNRIEILDNSFWIRSKNLKQGDAIISKNGYEVVSVNKQIHIGDTYDFEILSSNHRYWSGDLSSHNTGKSSIAEGLALRIVQKKVSRLLFNKRVVMLDLTSMVSGTKYRGMFEERVKALMSEIEKEPDVILFIDEIHTIIGAGGASGSLDASNMLKPALARGEIQIIGATTLDEYRKHIEKDGALERRFQKVIINPASESEALQILKNIKDKYEDHHNVHYTDEALKACVDLTSRYINDRFLPDKAIDALDEVGSRVHISNIVVPKEITDIENQILGIKDEKNDVVRSQRYEEAARLRDVEKQLNDALDKARKDWENESKNHKQIVSEEDVAEVVSMMTGIPVSKVNQNENEKLNKMYESISGRVIGQDDAVSKIVKAIQRGRIGMKDPGKPILVSMLIGSSGVGKTELAKQVAKYLFDSEDAMIRIDMSEYMEKISVNRIIGSPSGYVGYEDSNLLDQIRRKPYCVLLMDEVEKAHPDVYNIFLQAFDDGQMTDSHGRKVSFKNCIIMMTSNVGTRVLKDFGTGVGFATKTKVDNNVDDIKSVLEKELRKRFAPEFINRIEEIIYFKDLDNEDISKIIELELDKTILKAKNIGYGLSVDSDLKDHLCVVGYDPQFGARPLRRAIQKWIDDEVTDFIIKNSPKEGSEFIAKYDKENDKSYIEIKSDQKTEGKKRRKKGE